jgi:LPXTG-motif cell wall-anchored protein
MYIEHKGGYDPDVITNPVGTQWHEIYPNFCTQYVVTGLYYKDKLEPGACIDLDGFLWCVEGVAIDIIVAPGQPPPVGGEAYPVSKASLLAPWIAVGMLLAGGAGWFVLRRRKTGS